MDRLVDFIKSGEKKKIIVLTGAGVSVAAGIPDFRSPSIGLYASLQSMKHLKMRSPTFVFEMGTFLRDPRPFWWIFGRLWPRSDWPRPTTFHYFLTLLERHGILLRSYTQNIDDLEIVAGLSPDKLINCHGVLSPCHCLDCGKEVSIGYCINAIQPNIAQNLDDYTKAVVPKCPFCQKEHVKPDVVFFGERLPATFSKYKTDFPQCDLLIVCGSSLQVDPVCDLPRHLKSDVPCFLINKEKVKEKGGKMKELWDGVKTACTLGLVNYTGIFDFENRDSFIGGDLQENCLELISRLGWSDELEELKKATDYSEHPLAQLIAKENQDHE